MSRRHAPRTLEEAIEIHGYLESSWWSDEIPGHPGYTWHDWQDAFADRTLDVLWTVWRKTGATLYAPHRDVLLRDDLQSWLGVKAQELANKYTPNPLANDPARLWAGYLHKSLTAQARWHFGQYFRNHPEAQEAHNKVMGSIEGMTEALGDSWITDRMILHGEALNVDPLNHIIRLERLEERIAEAEEYNRIQSASGVYVTQSQKICLHTGCLNPAHTRDLCRSHYETDQTRWTELRCNVPDCNRPHKSRGLCGAHVKRWRAGTLPPELEQYVEMTPRPKKRPTHVGCTVEGCPEPHNAKGMCKRHYRQAYHAAKKEGTTP